MNSWRDINRDAWSFSPRVIVGSGGGIGEYQAAYAINLTAGAILNGRIAAELQLSDRNPTGAGLVCRADEDWTFLAFYTAPSGDEEGTSRARIGLFKFGVFTQLAVLADPIQLSDTEFSQFSLEFFSGHIRGEIRTGSKAFELHANCPHVPFPGYVGLVKFYGTTVVVKGVTVEKTDMPFAATRSQSGKKFEYDAFLCHSSADKPAVLQLAADLKAAGVIYWLDSEQIKYGDSITAKIESGLQASRYVVPCLSTNLTKSGWTRAEYGAILNAEFSGPSERVVIPLKLDDASDGEIPLLLRDKKRVTRSNQTEFGEFVRFLLRR